MQQDLRLNAVEDEVASEVFIDANHFKTLNDTHGHAAGDEILQQIATRLTAFTGPHDTAARLGGDEFAVLLHHTTTQQPGSASRRTDITATAPPYAQPSPSPTPSPDTAPSR